MCLPANPGAVLKWLECYRGYKKHTIMKIVGTDGVLNDYPEIEGSINYLGQSAAMYVWIHYS